MNSKLYIEREKPKIIECYLNADEDITSLLKSKYPYILDSIMKKDIKLSPIIINISENLSMITKWLDLLHFHHWTKQSSEPYTLIT